MNDTTVLMQQIQEGSSLIDKQDADLIVFNELLRDDNSDSAQDADNSAVYDEYCVSHLEKMQLSPSTNSSQETLLATNDASEGTLFSKHSATPMLKEKQPTKFKGNHQPEKNESV